MKFFKCNTTAGLTMMLFLGYGITWLNSGNGQNMTTPDNTTGSINLVNASRSGSGSLAKHMGEALEALESENKEAASTHLTAIEQSIASSECEQAKMHFNESMRAFTLGDSKGALKHLNAANNALD